MVREHAVIIGAGMGGLSAAISLAREGYAVTVLERAATVGGKMREVEAGGAQIDAGPTVLTMHWVFDALFEAAGARLGDYVALQKLSILARHAWSNGAQLDLFADEAESADAIGAFAGAAEARGYLDFCAEARRMYETLREPFLTASRPNPLTLTSRVGLARIGELFAIRPFDKMWNALGLHFRDQRLRQLFGRYATYCGSSPFEAPGPLMLIAHVEQTGVWLVEGGMMRIATMLESLARDRGAVFSYGADVAEIVVTDGAATGVRLASGELIAADAVVFNGDPAALFSGMLGSRAQSAVTSWKPKERSLSALTWSIAGKANGFALSRHTVFF